MISVNDILGMVIIFGGTVALAIPLGKYIAKVYAGEKTILDPVFNPIEKFIYRFIGIDPTIEMNWKQHLKTLLTINIIWFPLTMFILMNQSWLPLNPDKISNMSPDLAFHSACAFITNCNQQHYSGETGLSYFSQLIIMFSLFFLTPSVALAAMAVIFNALKERTTEKLGNFYTYYIKSITRIMLPISFIIAIIFLFNGIPMTFFGTHSFTSLQGDIVHVARGPVAAFESAKMLGLNGAGFFGVGGIVFGDIGTSPLYTYTAIIGSQTITELIALGGVSAIFWTLFFQTTVKYVFITLRADNKGEGGIFSLYTLIRKYRKWLLFPAIAGGSFLLADSIITPPISVSSAIEGLKPKFPDIPVIPIVISIIVLLFIIQRKGTSFIGNLFGPVMLIWFSMIGVLGIGELAGNLSVFKALNPYYAIKLLSEHPGGFWLLGGVFLCTTGAEALYSDLGHCGRKNIQISWLYVKICLILCYFGQAAWLLKHVGTSLTDVSPFFGLVPDWFIFPAIAIATLATIIASQALISGSFTLVAEAIRLNLWPKLRVVFPSDIKGQLYIPTINWLLMLGCCAVVLYFKESKNMEAAFGLSVTLTMLMTTILLSFYLFVKRVNKAAVITLLIVFLTIEGAFLIANLKKFMHGGWVTLSLGIFIFTVMYIWYRAGEIRKKLQTFVPLKPYIPILKELSEDEKIPKYATNLVYLTSSNNSEQIEERSMYSILYKQPKRADVYWFVHIEVADEPYKMSYKTEVIAKDDIVWITFKLGFRIAPRINLLFRKVVEEMVKNKEINIGSRYCSLDKHNIAGDFRFVVMQRFLSFENELSFTNDFILKAYFLLKKISLPDEKEFGLDYSNVTIEKSPLIINVPQILALKREV